MKTRLDEVIKEMDSVAADYCQVHLALEESNQKGKPLLVLKAKEKALTLRYAVLASERHALDEQARKEKERAEELANLKTSLQWASNPAFRNW